MTVELHADRMIGQAERETGLSDWGDELFREPFATLVQALNEEADLHPLGAQRAYRRLFDNLCTRLRRVADRKGFPGIPDETIHRPLFVIGLPRAGTTFLHNLLACDPAARAPFTWEIMYPSPPPRESAMNDDPRIAQAEAALEFEGFMDPELQAIHPFSARRPEECNFIWEHSFLSVNFPAFWEVPSYARLLGSTDFRSVYAEHRQTLQHLQHRFRKPRWVLKSPAHMSWLDALFAIYPDALLVQCHRDPARVLGSLSSNLVALRRTFSNRVPQGEFGMLETQARGLKAVAAVRSRPELAERFFDAHYLEVQRDPMSVVRRIYQHFDLAFTSEAEAAMRQWLARDRESHARGPRHSYQLEDCGLDTHRIDAVLGDYMRSCQVQLER
jgi:hypothetical protein